MRLIDADALKEYIDLQKIRKFTGCTIGDAMKIMTDEQPTVDAVPVIRCKDCKHGTPCRFYESTWYVCTRNNVGIDMNADDYCSRAERKEEKSCG